MEQYENPQATTYIVAGAAGNRDEHNDPLSTTQQEWSWFQSLIYGFGELMVHNNTHVNWKYFESFTGEVLDEFWIMKDKTRFEPKLFNDFN